MSNWKLRDAGSYDNFATNYGQYVELLSKPLANRICELASLQPGMNVLDIGTGSGIAARSASNIVGLAGQVTAIDLSEGMIEAALKTGAPSNGSRIDYRLMDAEKLQFDENSFDAVISLCAVAHFPAIGTALSEMKRVLKPGGSLVVSFGTTKPIAKISLTIHFARQIGRKLSQPFRPVMKAPVDLLNLLRSYDNNSVEESDTEWSKHNPRERLFNEVRGAGFYQVRRATATHELFFSSPEEFWDAQAAIVTLARKQLATLPRHVQVEICKQYVESATETLRRNGLLVYPYGAYFVVAKKRG